MFFRRSNEIDTKSVHVPLPETETSVLVRRLRIGLGILLVCVVAAAAGFFFVSRQSTHESADDAVEYVEVPRVPKAMLIDGEKVLVGEGLGSPEIMVDQVSREDVIANTADVPDTGTTITDGEPAPLPGEPAPAGQHEVAGTVMELSASDQFVRVYDFAHKAVYTAFIAPSTYIQVKSTPASFGEIRIGNQIRVITNNDPATDFDVQAIMVYLAEEEGDPLILDF